MGEIPNPDGHGEFGSLACGDAIEFIFKTEKGDAGKEVITQARYKTFGCTSAIASSEALCFLLEHSCDAVPAVHPQIPSQADQAEKDSGKLDD